MMAATSAACSLCRGFEQAEQSGVEIYPGIAVTEAIFGENGAIEGVITGDKGIGCMRRT